MDEIEKIRDTLFQAMDEQYATEKKNNEVQQKLGQQQIMYNNDARGTLYSGQPTWERAQLAATGAQNLAKLGSNYMSQKLDIWNNLTSTLDQIESYNKAAAAMAQSTADVESVKNAATSYAELYASLQGGS